MPYLHFAIPYIVLLDVEVLSIELEAWVQEYHTAQFQAESGYVFSLKMAEELAMA